jgi:hypothetical protein
MRRYDMSRFNEGLIPAFLVAVKRAEIKEPFSTEDLREFVSRNNKNYSEKYIRVALPNSCSETHSLSYPKVFVNVGEGKYKLK